ncbi:UvrD-helicase domain-containing protein [Limibacter armeniacum]|uniref:UvrD-helicase domain-containing protein n=1 Tax=Limibacter armeniacum TaxID=466084 RepID=UPI002FE50024
MIERQFRIYRSSAGSGKTFTLTKEYLKLALTSPGADDDFEPGYFRHILAVTFTKDATNEMKARILSKLSAFATMDPLDTGDIMLEAILDEVEGQFDSRDNARETLCHRAKLVHRKLLHNYADFSVSTIDSFNQKIIQAFKKDLDLPFNFELELDSRELLDEATYLLHDMVGEDRDKALSDLLTEFALSKAEEEKNWHIDRDLFEFGQNLFNEDAAKVVRQLKGLDLNGFKQIKEQLFQFVEKVEEDIARFAQEALDLIHQHQLEDKHFNRKAIYNFFKKVASREDSLEKLEPNKTTIATIEDDKWLSGEAKKAKLEGVIEGIKADLIDKFYAIEAYRQDEELLSNYIVANQVRKRIFLLATINELDKLLEVLKVERNMVHISDVNAKINSIIEGEPVPYIYERIGERYKHILIDEFQDTSMMQWHNLVPLVSNALTNQCLCLVVGDAKQAIYRWRGGRADMLVGLPELPTAAGTLLEEEAFVFREHDNPQDLDTNFRSHKNVITFNNNVFETLLKVLPLPDLQRYYAQVTQKHNSRDGGQVKLTTISKFEDQTTAEANEAYDWATLEYTYEKVRELNGQGFRYGDIAILVRNNSQGVKIAQHLMKHKISVVSSESLLLTNSEAVNFIVDFFRLFTTYADASLRMRLLRYLKKHQYVIEANGSISPFFSGLVYNELAEKVRVTNSLESFVSLINKVFSINVDLTALQFLSLYEMVEELVRSIKLNELKQEQIYLHKFMEVVLQFSQQKGNSIQEFLQFWERKKNDTSITTQESEHSVRVMTIHKSKGLEFPAVIMPFADWQLVPRPTDALWAEWQDNSVVSELSAVNIGISNRLENTIFRQDYINEKQAVFTDAFNIFYVGLTRAGAYLHIITKEKPVKGGNIQNIGQLMDMFLTTSELDIREKKETVYPFDNPVSNIKEYHFFDDHSHEPEETKAVSGKMPIEHFIHAENRDRIRLRSNELEGSERMIAMSEIFSARKRGVIMHKAFERVMYREDIHDAVKSLVHEGLITVKEVPEYEEQMEQVVAMPEISAFFDSQSGYTVKNEAELLIKNSDAMSLERVKSLRPDRLLLKGKEAIVIDYKTGLSDEKYSNQVNKYASQLQDMGFQYIRKFIVYTEELYVEEVK